MTGRFPIVVVLAAIGGGCSTSHDASFCESDQDCEDAARPFCDVNGAFEGGAAVCIARPSRGDCDGASTLCQNPYPICNTTMRRCLACMADAECASVDAQKGVCAIGECVECEVNGDCGSDLPRCADNTCTACPEGSVGDALCKARSEGKDMCVGGRCSQCVENVQCPSALCDIDTEACVAEADVVYADAENGADGGACGTKAFPCQSIAETLARIDGQGRDWIKLADGTYPGVLFLDAVVAKIVGDGGADILPAVGEDDRQVVLVRSSDGPTSVMLRDLRVLKGLGTSAHGVACYQGGAEVPVVRLHGVLIENNDGSGIQARVCDVRVERSEISRNDQFGVEMTDNGASLVLERTEVSGNRRGGLSLTSTSFSITNNFITLNGSGAADSGGVTIRGRGPGPAEFAFNTISLNFVRSDSSRAAGVECRTGNGLIIVANNVIFDNKVGGVSGSAFKSEEGCFTAFNCADQDLGGSNTDATGANVLLNAPFDFHLVPDEDLVIIDEQNPCIDVADPNAMLGIDFDGDPRPQGVAHDPGADELVQQ